MQKRRLVLVMTIALTLVAAGGLHAQRGMGGGRSGRGGGEFGRNGGAEAPKALNEDDLAKADPARVLLDKAKDLKLTDAQKQALDTIVKRYEWNTHQFAKQVDSLNTAMRAEILKRRGTGVTTGGATSDTVPSDAATAVQRALRDALQSIRDEFNVDASTAVEKLDEGQRSSTGPIIGEARSKLNDLLTAAGSAGGRRGRGGLPPA